MGDASVPRTPKEIEAASLRRAHKLDEAIAFQREALEPFTQLIQSSAEDGPLATSVIDVSLTTAGAGGSAFDQRRGSANASSAANEGSKVKRLFARFRDNKSTRSRSNSDSDVGASLEAAESALASHSDSFNTMFISSPESQVVICARLLNGLAVMLRETGAMHEAETEHRKALRLLTRFYGNERDAHLAETLYNLGLVLQEQQQLSEAMASFRSVLACNQGKASTQQMIIKGHASLAMGTVLQKANERPRAMDAFRMAMSTFQKAKKPILAANAAFCAGNLFSASKKHGQALAIFEQVLKNYKQFLGADHLRTADAHFNVAAALSALKRHEIAFDHYKKAEEVYETRLGLESSVTLLAVERIAWLLARHLGNSGQAVGLYERIIASQGDKASADTINDYANALYWSGALEKSIQQHRRSIEMKIHGPVCRGDAMHLSLAMLYNNLGLSLSKAERYAEAQEQFERVLRTREACFGVDDVRIVGSLVHIGRVQVSQGLLDDAEASFRRAIDTAAAIDLPNPPGTPGSRVSVTSTASTSARDCVPALEGLANVCCLRARYDEAIELLQRALRARRRRSNVRATADDEKGLEDPLSMSETAPAYEHLASIFLRTGRYREAVDTYTLALESRRLLRPASVTTTESQMRDLLEAPCHVGIAQVLYLQGDYADALASFQRIFDLAVPFARQNKLAAKTAFDSLLGCSRCNWCLAAYDDATAMLQPLVDAVDRAHRDEKGKSSSSSAAAAAAATPPRNGHDDGSTDASIETDHTQLYNAIAAIVPPHSPRFSRLLYLAAAVRLSQGGAENEQVSRTYLERSLHILNDPRTPRTADRDLQLVRVYNHLALHKLRAESDFLGALELAQRTLEFSKDHNNHIAADAIHTLGNILGVYLGNSDGLKHLYLAHTIRQSLVAEHPDVAESTLVIGQTHRVLGQLADALPFFRQSVELYEKTLGVQHPHTINAREELERAERESLLVSTNGTRVDVKAGKDTKGEAEEEEEGCMTPCASPEALLSESEDVKVGGEGPEALPAGHRGTAVLDILKGADELERHERAVYQKAMERQRKATQQASNGRTVEGTDEDEGPPQLEKEYATEDEL